MMHPRSGGYGAKAWNPEPRKCGRGVYLSRVDIFLQMGLGASWGKFRMGESRVNFHRRHRLKPLACTLACTDCDAPTQERTAVEPTARCSRVPSLRFWKAPDACKFFAPQLSDTVLHVAARWILPQSQVCGYLGTRRPYSYRVCSNQPRRNFRSRRGLEMTPAGPAVKEQPHRLRRHCMHSVCSFDPRE